jgi:thiol:disulfide interchange protein
MMPMRSGLFLLALVSLSSAGCRQQPASQTAAVPAATVQQSVPNITPAPGQYVPVAKYDTARDPAADLRMAVAEATRSRKRILLEVGGEWCSWCHIMDAYFAAHPALVDERDRKFVTLKINYSEENDNKAFLSQYPKIPGYPHLFVLESDGTFLHSQGSGELESGRSYDLDRFTAFLKRWEPAS